MLKIKSNSLIGLLCLGLLLQSCAPSLPKVKGADKEMPTLPKEFPAFLETEEVSTGVTPWKDFLNEPALAALVKNALGNNQELNIIRQEINVSNNEVMAREGEYLPRLNFGAGYEAEKVGEFTHQGASDKATEYEPGKTVPEVLHNHEIGLYASWEVDIWARLRNATKAAYYRYLSSVEGQKFMITRVVAEVANTYYELLALDRQLEIVNQYVEILKQAQELLQYQQQAAKVTSLAVKRFTAEVLKNQSRQYELKQRIVQTENHLNLLVGRFPQKIERDSKLFENLRPLVTVPGIPAQLLENRPDVKEASLKIKAAKLDLKSAKARFYPSLSIDAGGGYQAFNAEHLYDAPQSIFYNIAGNLTAPLLNRKAIKADYFSANNKQIQAVYNYEYTLIKAFTEVVNQMSKINNLAKIYELKSKQVDALVDSVNISGILFKAARVDYVEALMTQRDSLEAQVELVEIKKEQLVSRVDLYKALGGGWRNQALKKEKEKEEDES